MSDVARPAPEPWILVTSVHNTRIWVRPHQIDSYGDSPPNTNTGHSWVSLIGSSDRSYLMTTVDELHVLLGNTDALQPA